MYVKLGSEQKRGGLFFSAYSNLEEGIRNIVLYTGQPPTSFEDWVEENKDRFNGR